MTAILTVAGLLALYTVAGAGRVTIRARRARLDEQAAQVAHEGRRDRVTPMEMGTAVRVLILEGPEDRAWRLTWWDRWNDHIAEFDAQFDALVAGMPLHDDAPFDPSYWPAVEAPEQGPEVVHVDLTTLAEFEPAAVLARVEQENAIPAVFSWHTSELPLVERDPFHPAQVRPRRRRATLRRALNVQPSLPIPLS
jgi:hypothetical protein